MTLRWLPSLHSGTHGSLRRPWSEEAVAVGSGDPDSRVRGRGRAGQPRPVRPRSGSVTLETTRRSVELFPSVKAGSTTRVIRGIFALGLGACTESSEVSERIAAFKPPEAHQRFVRIRALLGQDVQSTARSTQLYQLVDPVCRDPEVRAQFGESLAWSVSFSTEDGQLPTLLALDVVEHVATACARNSPEVGLEVIAAADQLIDSDRGRLDVLKARLLAASGALDEAARAAQEARDAGSVHAIALLANVQARQARSQTEGFEPGMLDEALATVDVEPTAKWQAIDLTAILATRARLFAEKAFWWEGEARQAALDGARAAFGRLAKAPFVEAVRRSSMDALCFDQAQSGLETSWCAQAAKEHGILGAGRVAGLDVDQVAKFDVQRAARLDWARSSLEDLGEDDHVLVVFRGDELELLEWARPSAVLLSEIDLKPTVVDRTREPRSSSLVTEILRQAELSSRRRLRVGNDPLAMPCIAALVAGRQAPEGCALPAADRQALIRSPPPRLAILIGRDLDAEIDDLELYEIPTMLLSFRRSRNEKAVEAWLKSLSDVWWLVQR